LLVVNTKFRHRNANLQLRTSNFNSFDPYVNSKGQFYCLGSTQASRISCFNWKYVSRRLFLINPIDFWIYFTSCVLLCANLRRISPQDRGGVGGFIRNDTSSIRYHGRHTTSAGKFGRPGNKRNGTCFHGNRRRPVLFTIAEPKNAAFYSFKPRRTLIIYTFVHSKLQSYR